MRDTRTSHVNQALRFCLALFLLSLGGCGSEPVREPEPEPPPVVEKPPAVEVPVAATLPPSAYSAEYLKADQLLVDKQWMAASEVLATIPRQNLTAADTVYLSYLEARILFIRGKQAQALGILDGLDYQGMNPAQLYRILNFRRYMVGLSGDYLESARLGDELMQLAPALDRPALKRGIWRDLQRLPTARLQQAAETADDPRWRDWLELALLTRAPLPATLQGLSLWLQDNPQHPAANPLPGGLGYLLTQPPRQQRVALLLPLSDRLAPAGRAVRDGYLASYYASREAGGPQYDIMVMDLASYGTAGAAYDVAVAQGASIVVGPLSKPAVTDLAGHAGRPVPVLALNRLEDAQSPTPGSTALVQFALAPEDEARDIAERAFGQGARNALVMRPQGDWGSKVAEVLMERWQALGGTIADSVTYSGREDYSASVKDALAIPASEQRARALRDMLGTNIEFNARRRQDIDVVFLLSGNGAEARSLKPLLAFHYAGSLPVYAISSIYGGARDPRDRDLDGVNFVEVPWLLGENPELRAAIAAGNTGTDAYTRLNALGADAFLVQSRFSQLQAGADALLRGNTGLLSMDPSLHIQRELVFATFDEGAIKAQ